MELHPPLIVVWIRTSKIFAKKLRSTPTAPPLRPSTGLAIVLWNKIDMHHHKHDHPHFSRTHHFPPGHWRGNRMFFFPFIIFMGGVAFLFLVALGILIYFSIREGGGHFHRGML